ncbi:hypothetical protein K503DRAFT_702490, partial [Rhizopogon vinicolor AM-OR11-026]
IDVDVRDSTCLFTRSEEQNMTTLHQSVEHGQEYEKAATRVTHGCEKATGHHRMISIDLGELKILLRVAVRACISPVNDAEDENDELQAFSSLEISREPASNKSHVEKLPALPIQEVSIFRTTPCRLVPQVSIIEIKTCASHRELNWERLYPQLYLSQTAFLYIAKHHCGNFDSPEKVELGAESMQPYARHAGQGMAKLKLVLQNILDAAKKADCGHGVGLSLVSKSGQLTLYKRQEATGKALGKEITSKFK